jgi:hypothetical protein
MTPTPLKTVHRDGISFDVYRHPTNPRLLTVCVRADTPAALTEAFKAGMYEWPLEALVAHDLCKEARALDVQLGDTCRTYEIIA